MDPATKSQVVLARCNLRASSDSGPNQGSHPPAGTGAHAPVEVSASSRESAELRINEKEEAERNVEKNK